MLEEIRKSLWLCKSTLRSESHIIKTRGGIGEINKVIFEALGHSNIKFFIVINTGLSGCDTENSLK